MNTLLRLPAVMDATGLAGPTVYLRIRRGLFPRPVKLSERAVAWPESEVSAINAARIAGKSEADIKSLVVQLEQQRGASV